MLKIIGLAENFPGSHDIPKFVTVHTRLIYYLYIHSYMFRSYDHHQVMLRIRIKTHIIRYHTRNRMQTPQIKCIQEPVIDL
jgi:hypothetical protein